MTLEEITELLHKSILNNEFEVSKENYISAFIRFTQYEVMQMPKTFRKQFRAAVGCVAYLKKYFCLSVPSLYVIRFFRNGYNVEVSGKDLKALKAEFIKVVNEKYKEPF